MPMIIERVAAKGTYIDGYGLLTVRRVTQVARGNGENKKRKDDRYMYQPCPTKPVTDG